MDYDAMILLLMDSQMQQATVYLFVRENKTISCQSSA